MVDTLEFDLKKKKHSRVWFMPKSDLIYTSSKLMSMYIFSRQFSNHAINSLENMSSQPESILYFFGFQ